MEQDVESKLNEITKGMNSEQYQACTSTEGAYRLIAGAGSGKTFTLTRRIAYIVASHNLDPARILNLTFTNKAAGEMRERAAKQLQISDKKINCLTFHSLALKVCQEDMATYMGWLNGVTVGNTPYYIYAELAVDRLAPAGAVNDDIRMYLKKRLANYIGKLKSSKEYVKYYDLNQPFDVTPANALAVWDYEKKKEEKLKERDAAKRRRKALAEKVEASGNPNLKNKNGETLDDLDKTIENLAHHHDDTVMSPTATWAAVALRYASQIGSLTFDDLINTCLYLFDTYPECREEWQNKFDYIQVDEFQDTDLKQLKIVQHLYDKCKNLFVVGDPDQSIYSFRGETDPELFNNLMEYIPNLITIFMNTNYRSDQYIVEAGNAVITLNKNRIKKDLDANDKTNAAKLEILSGDASTVAAKEFDIISTLIAQGENPNNICVLYRNNKSPITRELLQLLEAKLPDVTLDNQLVLGEVGVALINNTEKFLKFVWCTQKGFADYRQQCFNDFVGSILDNEDPANFVFMEDAYQAYNNASSIDEKIKLLCEIYMLLKYKDASEGTNTPKLKPKNPINYDNAVNAIKSVISNWESLSAEEKDSRLQPDYNLTSAQDKISEGLHIMTYHASKGLEFDIVIVNDMDNDTLLKMGYQDTFVTLEETARLAYVALTRAKRKLYAGLSNLDSPYACAITEKADKFTHWDNETNKTENLSKGYNTYNTLYDKYSNPSIYSIVYRDVNARKTSNPKDGDIIGLALKVPYQGENYLLAISKTYTDKPEATVTGYRVGNKLKLSMELNRAYKLKNVEPEDESFILKNYNAPGFADTRVGKKYLEEMSKMPYASDLDDFQKDLDAAFKAIAKHPVNSVKPIDKNCKNYLEFTYNEYFRLNKSKQDTADVKIRILDINKEKDLCKAEITLKSNGLTEKQYDTYSIRSLLLDSMITTSVYISNVSFLTDWEYWKPEINK